MPVLQCSFADVRGLQKGADLCLFHCTLDVEMWPVHLGKEGNQPCLGENQSSTERVDLDFLLQERLQVTPIQRTSLL